MFHRRSIQSILVSVLTVAVFFVSTTATLAVKPNPTPPGNHLNITEVKVDFDTSTIVITGEHFSFGNILDVTLGVFGSLNIVGVPTDTEIMVDFPAGGFPDGVKDYLLTVATGDGQSQNDEYDLTVIGEGNLPPTNTDCPCFGLTAGLTTWNDSFETQQCGGPNTISLFSFPPGHELQLFVDADGFRCGVSDIDNGPPSSVGNDVDTLTPILVQACKESLLAIAANDGADCPPGL